MRCPKCGSSDIEESLAYAWSIRCRSCGYFTSDYKTGPASAPPKEDRASLDWWTE